MNLITLDTSSEVVVLGATASAKDLFVATMRIIAVGKMPCKKIVRETQTDKLSASADVRSRWV